jgi:SLAP domain-containing protein
MKNRKLLRNGEVDMQKLQFESKWDKTISTEDRQYINDTFFKLELTNENYTSFTLLWTALNYRGELLVTAIVHNTSETDMTIQNTMLCYCEDNQTIAEYSFTIDRINLQPKTSMPWTFIFPSETIERKPTFQNGTIKVTAKD